MHHIAELHEENTIQVGCPILGLPATTGKIGSFDLQTHSIHNKPYFLHTDIMYKKPPLPPHALYAKTPIFPHIIPCTTSRLFLCSNALTPCKHSLNNPLFLPCSHQLTEQPLFLHNLSDPLIGTSYIHISEL